MLALSSLLSLSASQNLTLSAATSPFPNRTLQACAYDLSQSPPSSTASIYLLGGYGNGSVLSDLYSSSSPSSPPSFTLINDSPSPAPSSAGGGAAFLLNGDLLWFGGEGGIANNDVWVSQTAGSSWTLITANAAWASRSAFAYTTLPTTNVVVIAGGRLASTAAPAFNASDVWTCQDGLGRTWTQQAAAPAFGALSASALVGLYDHTLVLTGGVRNGSAVAETWQSSDVGLTWQALPTPAFGARASHSITVDADDILYVIGGSGAGVSGTSLDVYASNTKGSAWTALSVASTGTGLLNACAFVRAVGVGGKVLVLYGGQDASGKAQGVVVGSLSTTLGAASSTGIALSGNATNTAKPLLPATSAGFSSSSIAASSASSVARSNGSTGSSSSSGSGNGAAGIVVPLGLWTTTTAIAMVLLTW